MNDKLGEKSDLSIEERFFLKNSSNVFNHFDRTDKVMTLDDIYSYVVGRNENIDMRGLAESPILISHYRYLLKAKGCFFSPKVVAAKTNDEQVERSGDGFFVKLIPSNSSKKILYAVVELKEKGFSSKEKRVVLHVYNEFRSCCKIFPPFHDDKTQLLIDRNDDFVSLLSDDMSEVSVVVE